MSRLHADGLGLPTVGTGTPIAYTSSVAWPGNTIGTISAAYLKTPGLLQCWVSFTETAGTASQAVSINMPPGFTAISLAGSLQTCVGTLCCPSTNNVYGLTASAGQTLGVITVTNTVTGIVATWSAYFAIPTLT